MTPAKAVSSAALLSTPSTPLNPIAPEADQRTGYGSVVVLARTDLVAGVPFAATSAPTAAAPVAAPAPVAAAASAAAPVAGPGTPSGSFAASVAAAMTSPLRMGPFAAAAAAFASSLLAPSTPVVATPVAVHTFAASTPLAQALDDAEEADVEETPRMKRVRLDDNGSAASPLPQLHASTPSTNPRRTAKTGTASRSAKKVKSAVGEGDRARVRVVA